MEENNTFKLVLSRSLCRAFGILNLYYEIDHSIHGSINVIRNAEIILPRKQMLIKISMKTLPFMSAVEKEFLIDPPDNCECCTVTLTGKINWFSTFIPFLALFSPIVEIIVKSIDYGKRDSLKCITTGDVIHNGSFLKTSISTMLKIGAWLLGIIAYIFSLILYMRFVGLYDILYKPEIFDSFPALTGSLQDRLNGIELFSIYIFVPIITFILWLITFFLYYLSKRMRQQKLREVSLGEPFILYLRSFVADVQTAKSVDMLLSHGKSEEEETVDVFSEIAPVVAIGNPQDRNLPLGAARLYFSDDVWKQKVLEMLSNAKLVVLRLGETSNFWWEVHNAMTYCPLEKVIFLIPAMKTSETIMRLRKICQEIGIELPEITAEKTSKGSVSSVLYYENGKMICQTLKISKFTAFFISYREMLKKALQPVWAAFGFSPRKYHFVRLARIIAVLVLFSSLLFSMSSIINYFQKRQELRFQAWKLVNDLREYHPAITESWPEFPSDNHGKKLFKHIQIGLILLPDDEFYDCFKTLCGFIAQKQISESLCDSINHDQTPSTDLFLQFMYAAKHTCTEERYQILVRHLAKAADLYFQKMTINEGIDIPHLSDPQALKEETKIISDHLKQSEDFLDCPLPSIEIVDLVLSAECAKVFIEALDEIEAKGLNAQKISRPIYLETLTKLSPSFTKKE